MLAAATALLLIAAHFVHAGLLPLAVISVLLVALLAIPRRWASRTLQGVLGIAALEWIITGYLLAQMRISQGGPYLRLVIILGAVAVFTAIAAALFELPQMRARYARQPQRPPAEPSRD